MEILRAPDGSGPLFRVTPQGGKPVEGPSATKAWQALYTGEGEAGKARSLGVSGEQEGELAAAWLPVVACCWLHVNGLLMPADAC